jgi:hypothetical protein
LRPCDHLVIDGGRHGFLNGGHAHADALAMTVTLGGRALFIDPGTATYTMSSDIRDRFRCSLMHNTLTLDGRSQSVPAGPFHWSAAANAWTQRWVTKPELDYFEGVHDGYLPAVHRRRVLVLPGGPVVVVDSVTGDRDLHLAEVLWHLDPAWRLDGADRGGLSLRHTSGARAWVVALDAQTDFSAGDADGLGWRSPAYGKLEPALTLRLATERTAPFAVVTVFGEGALGAAPAVQRVPVETPASESDAVALQLHYDEGRRDLLVFGSRPPVMPAADGRQESSGVDVAASEATASPLCAGDVETDARMLWLRLSGENDVHGLVMVDGGQARSVTTGRALLDECRRDRG